MTGFNFACPACRTPLQSQTEDAQRCPGCERRYERISGIWRMLLPEREETFSRFIREYETIRQQEGRGSTDPAFYHALPYHDLNRQHAGAWAIRARSFDTFLTKAMPLILADNRSGSLRIFDLGAGNGWLSNRLAQQGHKMAAVDLSLSPLDGLGAHLHYPPGTMLSAQAEFDRLPFVEAQLDLILFNASFHYSVDYGATLGHCLTLLAPGGWLVIIDTPVYLDGKSGQQMLKERHEAFQAQYGFPSDALPSEAYLSYGRLDELERALALRWRLIYPVPRWRLWLRRWRVRLRGQREPAHFPIIMSRKPA
jgi:SAM-dependent methyltransferase